MRLFLRLRDKLKGKRKQGEARTPVSPCEPVRAIPETVKLNEKEKGTLSSDFLQIFVDSAKRFLILFLFNLYSRSIFDDEYDIIFDN